MLRACRARSCSNMAAASLELRPREDVGRDKYDWGAWLSIGLRTGTGGTAEFATGEIVPWNERIARSVGAASLVVGAGVLFRLE